MPDAQRPTARQLLDAIVRAMHAGIEELDEGLVLVPPSYDVLLHPDAHRALLALLPRIRAQARTRLDAELARLNDRKAEGTPGVFRRLRAWVRRLFFADRYHATGTPRGATYERAGDGWRIDIGATAEPEAALGYLAVETSFEAGMQAQFKGRPTINIRRRTVVLPDGRFETVVTAERLPAAPRTAMPASNPTIRTAAPERAVPPPSGAFARLRYEDDTGPHVYYMSQPLLRLGRHSDDGDAPDLAFHTLPDVSREHAYLRYDATHGTFALKDVSRFGVAVDGARVHASRDDDDPNAGWHPLPRHARIVLADAVFITFDAL